MFRRAFGLIGLLAACGGPIKPDQQPAQFAATPIASVTVVPDTLQLNAGGPAASATCQPYGRNHKPLLRGCTWISRNPAIASVTAELTQDMPVTGRAAGKTWVVATVASFKDSALACVTEGTTMPCIQIVQPANTIAPGDNWQAKATAAATGTQFRVLAGIHNNATVIPKTGQQFLGDPGAIMDGGGVTQYAFNGANASPYPDSVVLRGLEIRNYDPPFQMAAVRLSGDAASQGGTGWMVLNNNIHDIQEVGLRVGNGSIVRNNNIHHNLTFGVSGPGDDIIFADNYVAWNGQAGNAESGACKFVRTNRLIVRGNTWYRNIGPGIWLDIVNETYLIENNLVEENVSEGIVSETNFGGIIRYNTLRRNGLDDARTDNFPWAGAIAIHASHGRAGPAPIIDIYGNTLEDNGNGITLIQQDRGTNFGDPAGNDPVMLVQHVHIHENTIKLTASIAGFLQTRSWTAIAGADDRPGVLPGQGMYDWAANDISSDNNTIDLAGLANTWTWNNGYRSTAYWQTTVGLDTHSAITP